MSFTLGSNDLVSGVTFFFFSCISVRESSSPKTASEAKQRAPPGKTREVGEVGKTSERLTRLFASEEGEGHL